MGEREKIAQIIAEHLCPQGKAHKTLYGAERMCYSRNNFADCEKVSECVDALIAANIGDATAWKERAECAKRILQMPSLPDGKTYLAYFEYKGERIQDIVRQRDEYKHRAEVAERALIYAVGEYRCDECPCAECTAEIRGSQECIELICAEYKKQAEREIEEEKGK